MSEILLLSSDEITGLPASRIPFCRKPMQVHPYRHVLWRNIHHLEQIFAHIDTVIAISVMSIKRRHRCRRLRISVLRYLRMYTG